MSNKEFVLSIYPNAKIFSCLEFYKGTRFAKDDFFVVVDSDHCDKPIQSLSYMQPTHEAAWRCARDIIQKVIIKKLET